MRKKQPAHKPSGSTSQTRTGLIIRLCAVLMRAGAQRERERTLWRDAFSRAALQSAHADYQLSKNPLHLLEGIVIAQQGGVPVPDWILDPLLAAVLRVLAGHGALTLDKAIGLGKKRWIERKQREKDDRLKWLVETTPRLKGTSTTVSAADGAGKQAFDLLAQEGDGTYADVDSLIQRYNTTCKTLKTLKRPPTP